MFSVIYSLTITQPAHHDMRTRCDGDRPEMFPLGEGYGILGVPRDGGRSDEDGHRQTGAMNPARLLAVFAAIGLWAYSASAADLRPEDAASHIGETATVCGVVASAKFEAHGGRSRPYWISGSHTRMRFLPRSYTVIIGPSSALPKPRSAASAGNQPIHLTILHSHG